MPITRREALVSVGAFTAANLLPVSANSQVTDKTENHPVPASEDAAEVVCLTDFEPLAKERLSHMAWEYFSGGAADEITVRWNREAYQRIRLKPSVLVDVSKLDTRVTILGQEQAFPILLAPTSYHKLAHPEANSQRRAELARPGPPWSSVRLPRLRWRTWREAPAARCGSNFMRKPIKASRATWCVASRLPDVALSA